MLDAIKGGVLQDFKFLAKNRTEMNEVVPVNYGRKPIHFAAKYGRVDIMEYLLANEVDVNDIDKNGWTPLHYAAKYGNLSMIKYLIQNKAYIDARTEDGGKKYVHIAAEFGHINIIKDFLNRGDISVTDKNGWSLLHHASYGGHLSAIQYLIDNDINIRFECNYKSKPIHVAAKVGSVGIVQYYLRKGISIEEADMFGRTALHYAASSGRFILVEYLTKNNAYIHAKSIAGETPMHLASENGHLDVIEYLFELGVTIIKGKNGWNLLHYAAQQGHLNVMKFFMDKISNMNKGDVENEKKSSKVSIVNEKDIVGGLTPLHYAAKTNLNVVQYLISECADIYAITKRGDIALHLAATSGRVEIVEYFLKLGININQPGGDAYTPLHLAAQNKQIEMVKFLIKNFACLNSRCSWNWTPLHYAAQNGSGDIIVLLLENGASTFFQDTALPSHILL